MEKEITSKFTGKGTVLIADDEEMICEISKYVLEQIGFKVLTAYDGVEAVNVFREHAEEIVCVLLDLTMPHLSGEEVFREINIIKPGIKVIFSSGYNEQYMMQRFSNKGIVGFIQKPYDFKLLTEKLRSFL